MAKKKKIFRWRVDEMCSNCPFMNDGDGLMLREGLGTTRWQGIMSDVLQGRRFDCHKTTRETGNGTDLYCAGALAFQKAHGVHSTYAEICEGLSNTHETKTVILRRLIGIAKSRR